MALVSSGLLVGACGGIEYPPDPAPQPKPTQGGSTLSSDACDTIKAQARAILQTNCAGCHESPNKAAGFDYIMQTDRLKSSGLLVPGNPEGSRIYGRIAAGEMPPQGQTQRPTNSDATVVYQWIKVCSTSTPPPPPADGGVVDPGDGGAGSSAATGATTGATTATTTTGMGGAGGAATTGGGTTTGSGAGGAAVGTAPVPSAFIDNTTIMRWISTDISIIRLADQPFQRYLSLAHLVNAGANEQEMDLNRYAMGKAVNALSQGTQVVRPWAIDQYRTVYRIDVRDLEWDATSTRSDKWETLVNGDPYAIEFVDDAAQIVKQLTKTKVPVQSGNWIAFGGTQPPLYHDVVGIPTTLSELQRQLGVNLAQDLLREQVWRSGFTNSGVALHNRVLERHEIPAGGARTFWISFDFANDGGKENIFANPLDFQSDAGEIIFNLPNGMHGYMIIDAAGRRLDIANTNIAVDPSQRNATVTNGISCMGCHDGGIKFKKDEIGPFVSQSFNFDTATKDKVNAIYSTAAEFQSVVAGDSSVFLGSVQRLNPPTSIQAEPISAVFRKFEEDVDLVHAASELGLKRDQLLAQLGRLDPGLAPLETGAIKRDVWRAKFAQTVCLLRIGLARDAACGSSTSSSSSSTATGSGGAGGSSGRSSGAGGFAGYPR